MKKKTLNLACLFARFISFLFYSSGIKAEQQQQQQQRQQAPPVRPGGGAYVPPYARSAGYRPPEQRSLEELAPTSIKVC